MVLHFEKATPVQSRYNVIRRPITPPVGSDDEENPSTSKEYATFLKETERKVGPDGFLDSDKLAYPYLAKKEKEEKDKSEPRSRAPPKQNVVSLSQRISKDKKDHEKTMKVIEDHMWKHKQTERELKRREGDVIKSQRLVRHSLRDYENALNKKKLGEEKKLNTELEKYTILQQEQTHRKEQTTKSRIVESIIAEQMYKDSDRKAEINLSDLARKCVTKMSEIELKRTELMRINEEYEAKLKAKEQEEFKLKNELAELSTALNMEANKARSQQIDTTKVQKDENTRRIQQDLDEKRNLEDKLKKSAVDSTTAETNKRRLSADLAVTKEHLAIRQRDKQRNLTDTQHRLGDNTATQRKLNEDARYNDTDLKAKQIEHDIGAHNNRRINLLQTNMKLKKDKEEEQHAILEARFKKRQAEQEKKEKEDSLKFFQKMVSKGEEAEQSLYGRVRNAEYGRQKQEQNVRRVQQSLGVLKRDNAAKLTREIASKNQQERDMEILLNREKAKLDKTHADREFSYTALQKHRSHLQVDKLNLNLFNKEHARLSKIATKSDTAAEAY